MNISRTLSSNLWCKHVHWLVYDELFCLIIMFLLLYLVCARNSMVGIDLNLHVTPVTVFIACSLCRSSVSPLSRCTTQCYRVFSENSHSSKSNGMLQHLPKNSGMQIGERRWLHVNRDQVKLRWRLCTMWNVRRIFSKRWHAATHHRWKLGLVLRWWVTESKLLLSVYVGSEFSSSAPH